MKKRVNLEDISAYLDDESTRAHHVSGAVRDVPDIQERYIQYTNLSERLRALPQPAVRPGFAGDVIRKIEAQDEPRPAWWSGLLTPLATAALFLVFASFAALIVMGQNEQIVPTRVATDAVEADSGMALASILNATYDARSRSGAADSYASDASWLFGASVNDAQPDPVIESADALIAELAEVQYFNRVAHPPLRSGADIGTALNGMSEDEARTFVLLLNDYAQNGEF